MEKIIGTIIQVLVIVIFGCFFVLGILYLVKKDEDIKVTDKDFCIAGLFVLPIFWTIFVLDIIRDFLVGDLSLIPVEIIFVGILGAEIYLTAKSVRR